jgi:Uma2 family endonuclease
MGFAVVKPMTEDEYLASEATSPVKREFLFGFVHAMAGASERHNTIALNLASACHAVSRGGPCRTLFSDMRLRLDAGSAYYYPDVMVVCGAQDNDPMFKTAPCLIAEVMSPTTEAIDRREKLVAYQKLPSLREYVLIAQDDVRVEVYQRFTPREWGLTTLGPGDSLELKCLPMVFPVNDIYAGVDFDVPR